MQRHTAPPLATCVLLASLCLAPAAVSHGDPSAHRSMGLQLGGASYTPVDGARVDLFEIGFRLGHVFVFGSDEQVWMNFDLLTPRVLVSPRAKGFRCALELSAGPKAGPLYPGVRVGAGVMIAHLEGQDDRYPIHGTFSLGLGVVVPVHALLQLALRYDHVFAFDVLTRNPALQGVDAVTLETIVVLPR
jgi:hypothetical protein